MLCWNVSNNCIIRSLTLHPKVKTLTPKRPTHVHFSSHYLQNLFHSVLGLKQNKKLSYRRETARQLPTWRGLSPPVHSPSLSGYTYAYGRIRNPQQTYAKRAVRKAHFKWNRAFKVILIGGGRNPERCIVVCRRYSWNLRRYGNRNTTNSSISTTQLKFEDVPARNAFEYLQTIYISRN